ncbi:hypothetical protein [Nesterenkonia pannonica]|uniref:hypothetical protein n=1 Tax=Nesterenkonia pannonica TaxID=1548602 RepID=UPI002164E4AC|nr:hypothetical protein [Nesterenkonia pannonica]
MPGSVGGGTGLEGEDGRTNIRYRGIDESDLLLHGVCAFGVCRCVRLQAESCAEEPLDHVIVQIPCDACAVLDDLKTLPVGSGPCQRDGETGLA